MLVDTSKDTCTDITDTMKFEIATHMDSSAMSDMFRLPSHAMGDSAEAMPATKPRLGHPSIPMTPLGNVLNLEGSLPSPHTPSMASAAPGTATGTPGRAAADASAKKDKNDKNKKDKRDRALPTTPLARGQALCKAVHKTICSVASCGIRMSGIQHQDQLKSQMKKLETTLATIYNELTKLVKAGVNDEASYEKLMNQYLNAKSEAQDTVST